MDTETSEPELCFWIRNRTESGSAPPTVFVPTSVNVILQDSTARTEGIWSCSNILLKYKNKMKIELSCGSWLRLTGSGLQEKKDNPLFYSIRCISVMWDRNLYSFEKFNAFLSTVFVFKICWWYSFNQKKVDSSQILWLTKIENSSMAKTIRWISDLVIRIRTKLESEYDITEKKRDRTISRTGSNPGSLTTPSVCQAFWLFLT